MRFLIKAKNLENGAVQNAGYAQHFGQQLNREYLLKM